MRPEDNHMGRFNRILDHALLAGFAVIVAFAVSAAPARSQQAEPRVIQPSSLKLAPSSSGGGVMSARVVGDPARPGAIYAVHARYPAGAKSFPHAYPDQRVYTVISGTFYVGTGADLDEKKLIALKPGTLMIMPAKTVHFGWAKDGEVIVQEMGVGPSGTRLAPAR
jgi:quercetin dioxygenase-like cupin family protein